MRWIPIVPKCLPVGVDHFVDGVVPILDQLDIFHDDDAGETLRDYLGLEYQYGLWQPIDSVWRAPVSATTFY